MKADRRGNIAYYLTLVLVAAFASFFVAAMGYLNYRSTAIEQEEQVISRIQQEMVSELETAIGFGKNFENYYGMEDVFASFEKQFTGVRPFVIDASGKLLNASHADGDDDRTVRQFLASGAFFKAKNGLAKLGSTPVVEGSSKALFTPVRQDEAVIGYFGSLYTNDIFAQDLQKVRLRIGLTAVLTVLLESVALAVFVFWFRSRQILKRFTENMRNRLDKHLSAAIMAAGILILSFSMLALCREDYRIRTKQAVETSLTNLKTKIQKVESQGVNLREVEGLQEYIEERVRSLNELHIVRISERISEVARTDENSALITFTFDSENGENSYLYLEAEISEQAIEAKMRSIVLILLSSLIILLIFVFEMNPLVELISARYIRKNGKNHVFSEERVGLTLRFTGFLCSMAEYMCVPYAAMMIRESQDTLFGLSVGMTAALPLTLEGLTQMAGMLLLPRFVKRYRIRPVLVLSTILMVSCNLAVFFAGGTAAVIVLCRALAGIAYAGMKQASNYLITKGYETERGRSENISQDNAGLLAGATCGAGLGAIFSSSIGYPQTFLFSAIFFGVYLTVIFFLPPWRQLAAHSQASGQEASKRVNLRSVARLLFSGEMLFYIVVVGIPLNIGVMLCVTLIPAICQTRGISSVMLSYCYIANGLAGIYLGPALVSKAKERLGIYPSIAVAFALTAVGIFILRVPPVMVMIVVSSMALGFLDGFGTPMVTDCFLSLRVVRDTVDESTALIFSVVLSYVLLTVAPMVAELLLLPGTGPLSPMMIGAAGYVAAAILILLFRLRKQTRR